MTFGRRGLCYWSVTLQIKYSYENVVIRVMALPFPSSTIVSSWPLTVFVTVSIGVCPE